MTGLRRNDGSRDIDAAEKARRQAQREATAARGLTLEGWVVGAIDAALVAAHEELRRLDAKRRPMSERLQIRDVLHKIDVAAAGIAAAMQARGVAGTQPPAA